MRYRIALRYFSIILALVMTGCASDRESHHSFRIEEIEGVLTAVNKGGPKFSDQLFQYEKTLEIRTDESRPESALRSSEQIVMDEDGFFYVEDTYQSRVAVFDPDGRYVRDIGGPGGGPGEFERVSIIGLRDDILSVYDPSRYRLARYRTNGILENVSTFPRAGILGRFGRPYLTPEGHWIIISWPTEEGRNVLYERVCFLTLTADLDTIGAAETAPVPREFYYIRPLGGGRERPAWARIPYSPEPTAVYVPGRGVLLSTGAEPELKWYGIDGTLMQSVTLDLPRESPSSEERSAYTDRLKRRGEDIPGFRDIVQAQLQSLIFSDNKAFWTEVTVDDVGYIWLMVPESPAVRETAEGYLFRVLSPDGEYLGLTRLPPPVFRISWIIRGHLLVVVIDPETDEYVPTVWRLLPQAEGFKYP